MTSSPALQGTDLDQLARSPMLVTCKCCQHVWPVLWTPCDIGLMAKVKATFCPMCGTSKRGDLVMARRDAGDLDRYADWLATELKRARASAASPST
jgi:hypothetical protein